jgi:hypothetical protein
MDLWGLFQVVLFGDSKYRRILGDKKWQKRFWDLSNGRRLPKTLKAQGPTSPTVVGHVK